jgi:hypothetical protein
MKTAIATNWQTTAAGLIVIGLGAAHTFLGIDVPGFTLDFIAALPVGAGLILAQDASAGASTVQAEDDPRFSTPFRGATDDR